MFPVTAETAPHYFALDHTAVLEYSTDAKMNPPLRTPEDVQAVTEGLSEDVIDVIATDHAPHAPWEKRGGVRKGPLRHHRVGDCASSGASPGQGRSPHPASGDQKALLEPARILNLGSRGRLTEGGAADLAIVDPACEYLLRAERFQSKSRNSPFIGKVLKGINLLTMVGGHIVWKR